jgi:hypothetical protein
MCPRPVRFPGAQEASETCSAADATDEIHIHGYDLHADPAPDRTPVVGFSADQTGLYEVEVEVEDAGVPLFQLLVR